MVRKILTLIAAAATVLNMCVPVVNAENMSYSLSEGAMVLHDLGLIENTADDAMTANITKGEIAQLLFDISTYEQEELSDFSQSAWKDDFFASCHRI